MIQLKGSELYAVEVPNGKDYFDLPNSNYALSESNKGWEFFNTSEGGGSKSNQNFEILGTFFNNEADFDVEPFVEEVIADGVTRGSLRCFKHYGNKEVLSFTAKYSFTTLIESNGLNPEAKYVILKTKKPPKPLDFTGFLLGSPA